MTWTDSIVSIMGAMNFVICFVAVCAVVGVIFAVRAARHAGDRDARIKHEENMEAMRLKSTKEITVRRDDT